MDDTLGFKDIFDIVVERMQRGEEMTTAKQEMMEDFIEDWSDAFGYDAILGESDK